MTKYYVIDHATDYILCLEPVNTSNYDKNSNFSKST